jgi:hypothetical protein
MSRTLTVLALLSLTLPLAPRAAAAQRVRQAVLVVHVADAQGRPLPRAAVKVGGHRYGALTDGEGNAYLPDVAEGNRLVEVRRVGFALGRTAADFAPGDTVRKEFRLIPAPVELEGLTVTSWGRSMALRTAGFYNRQRRGFGAFVTAERIEQLRPQQTNELFRQMRGFMLWRNPDGHQIVVPARGFSTGGMCLSLVFVDGMQMYVRDAIDQEMAINGIPPEDIAGIEAYAGAASIPAQYNPTGSACGVILIWTRQ